MADQVPVINIDMDRKCFVCGKKGATDSGLCLKCITKKIARSRTVDNLEFAGKKLERLETKLAKTRTALEQISAVPDKIKVQVRPGSITFKLEDVFVSFKALADEIKSKFGGKLNKEFNENNGSYYLWADDDGVLIRITGIPAPDGCEVQMQEVQVMQKKKRFLPFGKCESILK